MHLGIENIRACPALGDEELLGSFAVRQKTQRYAFAENKLVFQNAILS